MISEYAIEPQSLVDNLDRGYTLFRDGFKDSGRVLSYYPKSNWKRKCCDAFFASPFANNARLSRLFDELLLLPAVKRPARVEANNDWLIQAEEEHQIYPFHAILADDNPRTHEAVQGLEGVINDNAPCWERPRTCRVFQDSESINNSLFSFLSRSKHVKLFDPYFRPEPRYLEVLKKFAETMWGEGSLFPTSQLSVFSAAAHRGILPDEEQQSIGAEFQRMCEERVPSCILSGKQIEFVLCFEKEGEQQFHDRAIISELGGIESGQGWAQSTRRDDNNQLRLCLLDWDECARLERDFLGQPSPYTIGRQFSVAGAL